MDTQQRALVISHVDIDGHASAAISRKFLELCGFSVSYLGVDYAEGMLPSNEELLAASAEADVVVLTDFSLHPDVCNQLHSEGKLIWIDHHISAIRESEQHPYAEAPGLRRDGTAAQLLAWEYWTSRVNVVEPPPMGVTLFGKYDVFDQDENWELMVLPFQHWGLSIEHVLNPINRESQLHWEAIFAMTGEEVEDACRTGMQILSFQRNSMRKNVNDVHRAKVEGFPYTFAAINSSGKGSMQFEMADVEGCDAMMVYYFNGRGWSFGMYGWDNSPDLSEVAKAYGGGGHKHACGMSLDYIHPTVTLSPMPRREDDAPEQAPDSVAWPFFVNKDGLAPIVPEPVPESPLTPIEGGITGKPEGAAEQDLHTGGDDPSLLEGEEHTYQVQLFSGRDWVADVAVKAKSEKEALRKARAKKPEYGRCKGFVSLLETA